MSEIHELHRKCSWLV